jgi:hypothetical protein
MGDSSTSHPYGTTLTGTVNLAPESSPDHARRAAAGNIAWEEHVDSVWSQQNGGTRMVVRASDTRLEGRRWDWMGYALLLLVAWLIIAGYPTELSWGAEWLSNSILFGVGLVLAVRGTPLRHASRKVVLDVDVASQRLWIRQHPDDTPMDGEQGIELWRAAEVLFARRRVVVSGGGVPSDVAGVFLRLSDGAVWPIASGVRDHGTAFTSARAIARFLRVPLKQVGWGWGGADNI